jgi:hypothetical protein
MVGGEIALPTANSELYVTVARYTEPGVYGRLVLTPAAFEARIKTMSSAVFSS